MGKRNIKKTLQTRTHSQSKGMGEFVDSFFNRPWMVPMGIMLLSILLYCNTWQNDYAQDDAIVIHQNAFTTQGFKGIPDILTKDTFYGFFQEEGKSKLVSGGRYRPLSLVMFAIEWELFKNSPTVGHIVNSLLYGILGISIFFCVLSFRAKNRTHWLVISLICTLLYISHPVHTEVVANIKGRDEILSMLFSVLALRLSIMYFDKNRIRHAVLAGLLLFLGCLSKENAINFLIIIPLAIWIYRKASVAKMLRLWSILGTAGLFFLVIRFKVLGFDFGGNPSEMMNNPFIKIENNQYLAFTSSEKIATILFTLGNYVRLLFFPYPLTHDYYPRHIEVFTFWDIKVLLSGFMYLSMALIAMIGFKKREWFVFPILFYLISLVIVSNIIFPIGTNMSERFLFMPSFGFCLLMAILCHRFLINKKLKPYVLVCILVVVGIFSEQAISRNRVWKNDFTLFTTDVKISKNSAKLRNAVGGVLVNKAKDIKDEQEKRKMLQEAVNNLSMALQIHPNYKNAHLIMGNAFFYLKEYIKAEQFYNSALKLDPDFKDAQYNNAVNDRELGRYYGSQVEDLDKALTYFKRAYSILSDDYELLRLIGTAYAYKGDTELAIQYFSRALELFPESAEANLNLAKAYANQGNIELSNHFFEKAKQLDPDAVN